MVVRSGVPTYIGYLRREANGVDNRPSQHFRMDGMANTKVAPSHDEKLHTYAAVRIVVYSTDEHLQVGESTDSTDWDIDASFCSAIRVYSILCSILWL